MHDGRVPPDERVDAAHRRGGHGGAARGVHAAVAAGVAPPGSRAPRARRAEDDPGLVSVAGADFRGAVLLAVRRLGVQPDVQLLHNRISVFFRSPEAFFFRQYLIPSFFNYMIF